MDEWLVAVGLWTDFWVFSVVHKGGHFWLCPIISGEL